MLEYKTVSLPNMITDGVPCEDFKYGLTVDTCDRALAPIGTIITNEGEQGWALHSIQTVPQILRRKKSILELIFGWIPFIGKWLFPTMTQETKIGVTFNLYMLVFVREA